MSEEVKICECGCGEQIPFYNTGGKPARFKRGHQNRMENHPKWKDGKAKHSHGYILKKCKGHKRAKKYGGYVYEHILVYEEHNKCCVLPWAEIHHINGVKDDNRIQNLILLSKKEHQYLHHGINMSNRTCSKCSRYKTKVVKRPIWHWENDDLLCSYCYDNTRNKERKEKYREWRKINPVKSRKIDMTGRVCSKCGSTKTYVSKTGYIAWCKDGKGGHYCKNCAKAEKRKLGLYK